MVDVESDDPIRQSELEELKNKVSRMNKNLISIMNTVKNIEYNLNNKKDENKENTKDKDKDKERINKAFEKNRWADLSVRGKIKGSNTLSGLQRVKSLNPKKRL